MKLLPQNTTVIGLLEYDPELRYTPTGKAVCVFVLNEDIRCECWEMVAEWIANQYKMGDVLRVKGSYKIRKFEDMNGNEQELKFLLVTEAEQF